jgi:hypothetical protein
VVPYLLPDRLTARRYRDFLETVLPGPLEDVPQAVRQKLWFQHDELQRTIGNMFGSG